MVKTQPRRSIRSESRQEKEQTAREELRAFLEGLDPLITRLIVNRRSLTLEEWRKVSERQAEVSAAHHEYERLAIRIPAEWRRYGHAFGPDVAMLAELRLLGHRIKPGAPRVRKESTEHVLIAKRVNDAMARLSDGWALRQARKKAGGAESDNVAIRSALSALGYAPEEQLAILWKQTPKTAAMFLVARQTNKKFSTIKSSVQRSRRASAE